MNITSFITWIQAKKVASITIVGLVIFVSLISTFLITHASPPYAQPPVSSKPSIHDEGAWFKLAHFGKATPSPKARIFAKQQASRLPVYHGVKSAAPQWTALGPQEIDSTTCGANCSHYGRNSGRITALAINPNNSSEIWAGTADGGLWRSGDKGQNWMPLTDAQATLSIGAIAVDPTNPTTVYVGTGEANLNLDAYWGAGLLKTTDDGATWSQLGFGTFGGLSIARIAIDPNAPSHLLLAASASEPITTAPPGGGVLATNMGIWRSTDSGATWSQVLSDPTSPKLDGGTDVIFDPAHPNVAFAGLGNVNRLGTGSFTSKAGVYKSTDDGSTWSSLVTGLPTGNSIQRISLSISQNGSNLFGVFANSGTSGGTAGDLLNNSVYTSGDNGATWAAKSTPTAMSTDASEHQWWYNSVTAIGRSTLPVVPSSGNNFSVYIGGVDLWNSSDGGTTWQNLTNAYGSTSAGVHPDQHAFIFTDKLATKFLLGNDGGIWFDQPRSPFTNLNGNGLNITQLYSGSIGTTGSQAQLYGGAQDNGEVQYPAGVPIANAQQWNEKYGADGGDTIVDYTNNAIVYEESQYGHIHKSTDGGTTWSAATSGIGTSDHVNFVMPFVMSHDNHQALFAGTDHVYHTADGGSTWSAISPVLDTACGSSCPISALAVAPSNDNYVYAGDNQGNVYVSTTGGCSSSSSCWTGGPVNGSTGGIVTSLAVDPVDPTIVYATFANFAPGSGAHVFKSGDAGAHWVDISATLPNVPFESFAIDPNAHDFVFAGSDVGVFASADGGTNWSQFGTNLPNVAMNQLFTDASGTNLYIATHGRGVWQIPLTTPPPPPASEVFVGSGNGMYAYPTTGGAYLWRYLISANVSPPTVANGVVYFGAGDRQVYALNATTGALLWTYLTGYAIAAAPTVVNGIVYVNSDDGYTHALNAGSGTQIWSYQTYSNSGSGSVVVSNDIAIVTGDNGNTGTLSGLNANTGAIVWSPIQFSGQNLGPPVVADNMIYVEASNTFCYQQPCFFLDTYDLKGHSVWAKIINNSPNLTVDNGVVYVPNGTQITTYDALTGQPLTPYNTTTTISSMIAVSNGVMYYGGQDNKLYAVTISTLIPLWNYQAGGTINGVSLSVNNLVYLSSNDHYLTALNAQDGSLAWHAFTPSSPTVPTAIASHIVVSTPAIVARATPGANPTSQTVTVTNTGSTTLNWSLSAPPPAWLGMSVSSGMLTPNTSQVITLTFTIPGPAQTQTLTTTLSFTDVAADNVPVQVQVTAVIAPLTTLYTGIGNSMYAFAPTSGTYLWRYLIGANVSPPTVANGVVYFGAGDKQVYALNATTGALLWTYLTNYDISAAPTVANGIVYINSGNNYTYALNAGSGALIWSYQSSSVNNIGSVAISGNTAIVAEDNGNDGTLLYLDATTGAVTWSVPFSGDNLGPPVVADNMVFVESSRTFCLQGPCQYLQAYDLMGHSVWAKAIGNHPNVTVDNGVVYVPDGTQVTTYDALTGQQLVPYPTATTISSMITISNGVMYYGGQDNKLYAVAITSSAPLSFAPLWNFQMDGAVQNSPFISNGAVYEGANYSSLYALDTNTGALIWHNYTFTRSTNVVVG